MFQHVIYYLILIKFYLFQAMVWIRKENGMSYKTIKDGDKDEIVRTLKHHPVAASMDLFKSFSYYKEVKFWFNNVSHHIFVTACII